MRRKRFCSSDGANFFPGKRREALPKGSRQFQKGIMRDNGGTDAAGKKGIILFPCKTILSEGTEEPGREMNC